MMNNAAGYQRTTTPGAQVQVQLRPAASTQLGAILAAGFGRDSGGVPGSKPMRILGRYAIVLVVDGSVRYQDANGLDRIVKAGHLILIFPHLAHRYEPEQGAEWTHFWLVFEGPSFDLWQENGLVSPLLPIHRAEPIDYWLRRFEAVLGARRQPGIAPPLVEVCRLQLALAELLAAGGPTPHGEDAGWVASACALLEADLSGDLDLTKLAHDLGMSYDGFRKQFTRSVGQPPSRYRMTRRIERACEMTLEGNLTHRRIAELLGFHDEFHFSRRFKQLTGWSPRDYRHTVMPVGR
jgi:AraC-like DNA-binding protein